MGSVYMAICNYQKVTPVKKNHPDKENPLAKKKPSVRRRRLTKGTLLVKFGTSDSNDPKKRISNLIKKFSCMEHECYAYCISKYYKSIEEYMHARLEKKRVTNLWSRLDDDDRKSYCSREHYKISKKEALENFQKAIETIEEFPIEWTEEDV